MTTYRLDNGLVMIDGELYDYTPLGTDYHLYDDEDELFIDYSVMQTAIDEVHQVILESSNEELEHLLKNAEYRTVFDSVETTFRYNGMNFTINTLEWKTKAFKGNNECEEDIREYEIGHRLIDYFRNK